MCLAFVVSALLARNVVAPSPVQSNAFSVGVAKRYFQEAKWLSDDDNGILWILPLYGPMALIDHTTRRAILNEKPDVEGFTEENGVYVGTWPENMPIANADITFGKKKWTMLVWALIPTQRSDRAQLFGHELWHRIQGNLALPAQGGKNVHLNTYEGRMWIQLEAQALSGALLSKAFVRSQYIKDALLFRAVRQRKFSGSKREEDIFELNEGLASYTGIMLRGDKDVDVRAWHGHQVANYRNRDSYSTTFAYLVGASYPLLLDVADETLKGTTWRKQLIPESSLSDMLIARLRIVVKADEALALERAQGYGYEEFKRAEDERETKIQQRNDRFKKELVEGPVLSLPLTRLNISSRNDSVFPIPEMGTVYLAGTFFAEWGVLTVTDNALLAQDSKTVFVKAATSETELSGPGWSLKLNPGWKIIPGKRTGDFSVVKG